MEKTQKYLEHVPERWRIRGIIRAMSFRNQNLIVGAERPEI